MLIIRRYKYSGRILTKQIFSPLQKNIDEILKASDVHRTRRLTQYVDTGGEISLS